MDTFRSLLPRILVGAGITFMLVMLVLAGLSIGNPLQAAAFISGGLALGGIASAVGLILEAAVSTESATIGTHAQTKAVAVMLAEFLTAVRQGN